MPIKKTHEQFLTEFKTKGDSNLTLLGIYTKSTEPILVQCKICGYEYLALPGNLLKGKRCGVCHGQAIKQGYNSFGDLHPELLKYFINKEDAFSHRERSNEKVQLKCPVCNTQYKRSYDYLYKNGFHCAICDATSSLPNRILRQLLNNIPNISNIEYEKIFYTNNSYIRYDGYFIYNNTQYIIEMQGKQHYINTNYNNYNASNQQYQDKFKQTFAQENNLIYIAIDCKESNFSYIKNNLIKSPLNQLYDLTLINWHNIEEKSICTNQTQLICEDYETNHSTIIALSKKYQLDRNTITNILKIGKQYGLCPSYTIKTKRKVKAYDNNHKYIGTYSSCRECAQILNNLYMDIKFNEDGISKVLLNKQITHQGFYFEQED